MESIHSPIVDGLSCDFISIKNFQRARVRIVWKYQYLRSAGQLLATMKFEINLFIPQTKHSPDVRLKMTIENASPVPIITTSNSNSSCWPWQQCQNLTPKKWMTLCKRDLSHSVTAATSEKRMRILLLVVFLAKSASACNSKRNIPLTFGRCPDISPNVTLDRDRGSDWNFHSKTK